MRNVKLLIEYDGTSYGGWQRQNNAVTVQGELENAIMKLTKEYSEVIGCSRTDAGVHAKGFVANFITNSSIPYEKFKYALNTVLPSDIRILNSEVAEEDFHSRYNSKGKTYSYTIVNREIAPALYRNYVYHYKGNLNIENMRMGAKYFIGTHDFSAFKNAGSSVKTSVRTIMDIKIENLEDIIKIYVSGDGFLYNMVRIMVGTLIDVGTCKIGPEKIQEIIASKDRGKAGRSVPASGLCLEKVFY